MKNFIRRLPVKIICFILCVVFLCVTVASVFCAIFIALEGFYTRTEKELVWDVAHRDASAAAYTIAYSAISGKNYNVSEEYSPEKTNLRYALFNSSNSIEMANCDGNGDWEYYYCFRRYKVWEDWDIELVRYGSTKISGDDIWVFAVYLEEGCPVSDDYSIYNDIVSVAYALRYWIYAIALGSLAMFLTLFITLLCASGRRPDSDEIHAGYLNKIP
ncbi:MAG: hypothetical protein IIX67_06250, partial [Clostridia bacterium]|nr:hypothetical protein [Clostridia bacterium]